MENDSSKFRLGRLETLTDGLFAIVMTILVLDIKIPHDINLYKNVNLEQFLTGYIQDVLVYMVVFIVLAFIWFIHHAHTHILAQTDRNHIWINILLLMFVALVPFSSSLINKFPTDWLAGMILGANMLIIGLLGYASWSYATTDNRLVSAELKPSYVKAEKGKLLLFSMVSMLVMVTALVYPHLSFYVFLLAPLFLFANRLFNKTKQSYRTGSSGEKAVEAISGLFKK